MRIGCGALWSQAEDALGVVMEELPLDLRRQSEAAHLRQAPIEGCFMLSCRETLMPRMSIERRINGSTVVVTSAPTAMPATGSFPSGCIFAPSLSK